jgi:hypothetical protein
VQPLRHQFDTLIVLGALFESTGLLRIYEQTVHHQASSPDEITYSFVVIVIGKGSEVSMRENHP